MLKEYQIKLHLSNLSNTFVEMILRKIESKQIVSLQINKSSHSIEAELTSLSRLTNVMSLNIHNFEYMNLFNMCNEHFSSLVRLSLWYDYEINSNILMHIFECFQKPIKRLEIYSSGILCTKFYWGDTKIEYATTCPVESFLINIDDSRLSTSNNWCQRKHSCFSNTIAVLINRMPDLRYLRLTVNEHYLAQLLDANIWEILLEACYQLKTIRIELVRSTLEKQELSETATEIQNTLRKTRETIKFQIISI